MKATGLQLGDIVYWVDSHGVKHEELVFALEDKGSYGFINGISASHYKPIPLTKKLFDAIGFTKETNHGVTFYSFKNRRVVIKKNIYQTPHKKWYVYIEGTKMCAVEVCFVNYLHELQHHYASANIEFELIT